MTGSGETIRENEKTRPRKCFSFPKKERICLREETEALFASGSSFVNYPARTLYLFVDAVAPESPRVKFLISVPKKRLRRAVSRNRVKRLFREAFRLNKDAFSALVPDGTTLLLGMIYISDEVCSFRDAEGAISKAHRKLKAACTDSPISSESL